MSFFSANQIRVRDDTRGHPEPGRRYQGRMVFAYGGWGKVVLLDADFGGSPDSPDFYGDVIDFIIEKSKDRGTVYEFTGTYAKFKNGKFRFSGKIRKLYRPQSNTRG